MTLSPVQLVSDGGIRILKFTTDNQPVEDGDCYTEAFCSTAGENYSYQRIYELLGEVRFLVHLHHAMQHGNGDINYAGLFGTFGQFRFDNIRKALRNGGVTLFDPTCPLIVSITKFNHFMYYIEQRPCTND